MHTLAQDWLGMAIDLSIKSIVLAAAAALAMFALRLRDTNFRHRIWTAVLLGMLAMPLLVCVTPAVPLPRWLTVVIPLEPPKLNPIDLTPDSTRAANRTHDLSGAERDRMKVADSDLTSAIDANANNGLPVIAVR
jgi:hypothetical protein